MPWQLVKKDKKLICKNVEANPGELVRMEISAYDYDVRSIYLFLNFLTPSFYANFQTSKTYFIAQDERREEEYLRSEEGKKIGNRGNICKAIIFGKFDFNCNEYGGNQFSPNSLSYKFDLSQIALFDSILNFVVQEFNIDESILEEIKAALQNTFGIQLNVIEPIQLKIQADIDAIFKIYHTDSIPQDDLDVLIRKIEPEEKKRSGKTPLFVQAVNLFLEKNYLNAAVYLFNDFNKKAYLTPKEHSQFSYLLKMQMQSNNSSLSIRSNNNEQYIKIVAHALQGLMQVESKVEATNNYQSSAENVIKSMINLLCENDSESAQQGEKAIAFYLQLFKNKIFNIDPFTDVMGKAITKNLNSRAYFDASTIAGMLIDMVSKQNEIYKLKKQSTKLLNQDGQRESVSNHVLNSMFNPNMNAILNTNEASNVVQIKKSQLS